MKKYALVYLPVFLCFLNARGQVPYFKNYFLPGKNEPVQVNVIFQDLTGYLWCGTDKGLYRFNGVEQKKFIVSDSMPGEEVTAVAQDTAGRIWLGYKNGKMAFVENDSVKMADFAEGSAVKEISDILFDSRGELWFSTLGDGLYHYTDNRLYRIDEEEKMPDLYVYDIAEDHKGNIWCGTDGGIAVCTPHEKSVSIKTISYENGLPDNIVKKFAVRPDGTVWIATEEAGILYYDPAADKCKPMSDQPWQYGSITDFLFTGGEAWISCQRKGLVVYNLLTGHESYYGPQVQPAFSSINTLMEDAEGNIWAGTSTGITRTPGKFIEYIDVSEPSRDPNVVALAVEKNGSIWYSTKEGLFRRTANSAGEVITEKPFAKTAFEKNTVISLYIDGDGYVWAGFFGAGAVRMNPLTGKIRYLTKELYDGNILNISGKDDVIWLATLGGATQIKISGEQLNIRHFTRGDGLISDYIYQVFTDSKNRVWFGTDGNGVDMMDDAGFHHYTGGLKSKVVFGFAEDGNHDIWANVQDEGIFRFDGARFVAPAAGTKFADNSIHCLASCSSGDLAAIHDLGIDIYDVQNNKNHFFGEQFGMLNKKANLNAVAKDGEGRIYVGTDAGIIVFSGRAGHESDLPRPYIAGIKILGQPANLSPNLELPYDRNDITLAVSGFWYQNPDNLSYQYMLENYDRGWTTSRNNTVNYSSLPPGSYTFRLKVSDSDTFDGIKETFYRFTIHPPFWQTAWFYFLSMAMTVFLVYAFIKYREQKLRNDKRVLEEKNAELKKINMELDKFVYSVSHDLRAPLLSMLGVVKITEEESTDDFTRENLGMVEESITKLDGFIKDILDYSRNSRMEVKKQEIDFRELLSEITGNLKYMGAHSNPVDIQLEMKNQKPFHSDKNRISILLNNLISNAIRYQDPGSENPFVGLQVDMSDTETNIVVKDNGIGIAKENHAKIFDMFYRVSENSVGSGLGLYLVKEIVEKLNGEIKVESEVGRGTAFQVTIPNQ